MRKKKTQRGFNYYEFKDHYGQICSLQESSLATDDAIWLGVDNTGPNIDGPNGKRNEDVDARMHLNKKQIKKLILILSRFVEKGNL